MRNMQVEPRKPLSPVKANGQHQWGARGKEDTKRSPQKPVQEDIFAQSTTKPKKQSDKIPAFRMSINKSKIPRATPSPDAAAIRHAANGSQSSKIPKPTSSAAVGVAIPRSGSDSIISGFQSYTNPSFDDTNIHAGLATPEAMQILNQVGNENREQGNDSKNNGMGAIMNAYLRTGPQKLSPEPSKDYCIVAPKPAAVPQGGNAAAGQFISAAGVRLTADEYLRTGAQYLSPEPGMENTKALKVPVLVSKQPAGVQLPAASAAPEMLQEEKCEQAQQPASPEPGPTPDVKHNDNNTNEESLQGATPASVCSNIPDVFDDLLQGDGNGDGNNGTPAVEGVVTERRIVGTGIKIRLLPAVDSQQTTNVDSQATTEDAPGTNYYNNRQNNHGRGGGAAVPAASPTFMPSPEEEDNVLPDGREVQSRRPSPVAFTLPMSSSPGDDKEGQQSGSEGPDDGAAASSGSFSFGFGAGARAAAGNAAGVHNVDNTIDPGSPTPEAFIAPLPESITRKRSGSGDSVDQPNLFVSMLNHFITDGPGAYASPHRPRDGPGAFALPVAPWLQAGFASPRPGGGGAGNAFGASAPNGDAAADGENAGPSEGSPQSPLNCTPMHLLSAGTIVASLGATPELGKGDLVAWIDRRGMRDMLSSPAAADLRRMWDAMRESANAHAAAASAAAENEILRVELQEAKAALERLGAEHSEALTAAQAGQQWAEAEVVRAREAAQHMMALADQIQSTFALCEEEKAALAEELEQAWNKAAEAEQEAQAAASKAASSEQERAKAVELSRELQLAQAAAQRAATEAVEAQALARSSAAELAAIKEQLSQAHESMSIQDGSDSDNGEGIPNTPLTTLRAQLHSAHGALAALHASGSKYRTAGPTSPHLDRLFESSAHGLTRAQELLQQDTCDLHQANEELRALLSGVQARIQQLSPAGSEEEEEEEEQQETNVVDNVCISDDTAMNRQQEADVGTVTVDFRELRSVFAETTGQPVPSSPYFNYNESGDDGFTKPSCNIEIDGVMVTNIPPNAVSQVRSMVDYFEELAGVKGIPLTPEVDINLISTAEGNETSIGYNGMQGEVEERVWTPVPATAERLRAFLPPRAGVTPVAAVAGQSHPTPAGLPRAPATTPLDDATPALQRLHLQGLDALAELQYLEEEEESAEEENISNRVDSVSADAVSAGVPPTPETETIPSEESLVLFDTAPTVEEESFINTSLPATPEDSECFSDSAADAVNASNGALVSASEEQAVTPLDMFAIQQGGAAGLRDEVRARLQRLKSELQAARSKLSHVDRGLAAIATPNRRGGSAGNLALPAPTTRLALQGPAPSPFVQLQEEQQQQEHRQEERRPEQQRTVRLTTVSSAPAAVQITPAIAGATPRTRGTTRPSVRFADSVKFNSEDDDVQPRRRLQRTPGITSSTSSVHQNTTTAAAYRAAASPQPMIASTIRIADPIVLTPSSAFAMMATGGGSSSAAASARYRPPSASGAGTGIRSACGSVAAPRATEIEEPNPSRKLDLGSYDNDSSDDDDDYVTNNNHAAANTQGSARSRMAMRAGSAGGGGASGSAYKGGYNGHIHSGAGFSLGGTTPASRTPMAHPELSKYYGAAGDILTHYASATPLSRFSSASSYVVGAAGAPGSGLASSMSSSPDPAAALLSIRPAVGRVWRGHTHHAATGGGARRVSDSEEKEFRRRAAALKIHVSPYFKRTGPGVRAQRNQVDASATAL